MNFCFIGHIFLDRESYIATREQLSDKVGVEVFNLNAG